MKTPHEIACEKHARLLADMKLGRRLLWTGRVNLRGSPVGGDGPNPCAVFLNEGEPLAVVWDRGARRWLSGSIGDTLAILRAWGLAEHRRNGRRI